MVELGWEKMFSVDEEFFLEMNELNMVVVKEIVSIREEEKLDKEEEELSM